MSAAVNTPTTPGAAAAAVVSNDSRPADSRCQRGLELLALRHRVDGFEDLDVARATTQVRTEMSRHVAGLEVGALLVDLRLRPHHDPRDAEATLQATARRERIGERGAFLRSDTFQRDDGLAGRLGQRLLAADDRLAVDVHGAATALPRRGATVLGRGHVQLLAEGSEEVWVVVANGHCRAVEFELDAHGLHFVKVQRHLKAAR
jgi:hypothetical protein